MPEQTNPEALLTAVNKLAETVTSQGNQIKEFTEKAAEAEKEARKNPFGIPFARKGENALTSRGYSFLKALGVIANQIQPEDAKVEVEMAKKLRDYFSGYKGYQKAQNNSFFLPFAGDYITGDENLACEMRECVKSYPAIDPGEVQHLRQKMANGRYNKALSWLDDSVGGTLVAPPMMGELIELLRNNEVFMAAGAKVIPMPPQGRITWPRQTSAMTAYHVGESVNLTDSTPGTGDVSLTAKKLTILAKIPNELFHFSAIPIEGFVRDDMAKVMGLKMDKTLLEDVGSQTTPKGLINYANISGHTSTDPGTTTNGYKFQPKDVYQMVAKVEEQNAQFNAFIMRPLLWSSVAGKRADSIAAGDGLGAFLFNVFREFQDNMGLERTKVGNLSGYAVHKSTQIAKDHVKSGSSDLTYVLGGDFTDYLIAMSGAIEFAVSTQGDTPFVADQTWFKGVTYYDGAPRHEASFVLCDQLYQSF